MHRLAVGQQDDASQRPSASSILAHRADSAIRLYALVLGMRHYPDNPESRIAARSRQRLSDTSNDIACVSDVHFAHNASGRDG